MTPITPEERARLRAVHVGDGQHEYGPESCCECSGLWPCEVISLLAALDAADALAAAVAAFTKPMVGHFFVGHEREYLALSTARAAYGSIVALASAEQREAASA